jgi:hypothetical protein
VALLQPLIPRQVYYLKRYESILTKTYESFSDKDTAITVELPYAADTASITQGANLRKSQVRPTIA